MAKYAFHAIDARHGHGEGFKQEPCHEVDPPMVHLIRGAVASRCTVLAGKNNPTDDFSGDLGRGRNTGRAATKVLIKDGPRARRQSRDRVPYGLLAAPHVSFGFIHAQHFVARHRVVSYYSSSSPVHLPTQARLATRRATPYSWASPYPGETFTPLQSQLVHTGHNPPSHTLSSFQGAS